jgi:hypothetical protein
MGDPKLVDDGLGLVHAWKMTPREAQEEGSRARII